MPCSRIQRPRARATSARFCSAAYKVFFKADVVAFVEPPHRRAAALDPCFRHCRDDLVQCRVPLLDSQSEQEFRMFIKRRGATAARLCFDASCLSPTLHPNHHHAGADPIEFRNLTPRCPTFDCFNYSHTQILRIRLRHWLPQIESMSYIRSLTSTWESIRFNPTGKCSSMTVWQCARSHSRIGPRTVANARRRPDV